MKEKLAALWAKVVEHKEIAIRIGAGVAGALVGAAVVTLVNSRSDDFVIFDTDETTGDQFVSDVMVGE